MFLKKLNILYFRNIEEKLFNFDMPVVALIGNNGAGKTNALDAIYYLAMTKSYLGFSDVQSISFHRDFFVINGFFENDNENIEVICSVKKGEGKKIILNQKPYTRTTEHIGRIPLVFIAPQDISLITEYADTRRKFLDALIAKYDKTYLNALLAYQQALQSRNSIIKNGESAFTQQDLIEVYNIQMVQYGEIIFNKRKIFFEEVKSLIKDTYNNLQDNNEHLSIEYVSTIQKDFLKELQHSLPKDIKMGYSTIGVHRDDFSILLNNYPSKNFASQGQQKTIVFALKWMELLHLYQKTNKHPLFLIDDIYDRLDDQRLNKIKNLLHSGIAAQVIITDNHDERIKKLFQSDIQIIKF